MNLDQFDYELPETLIAQAPAPKRTQSRMLCLDDGMRDLQFSDFLGVLNPGDLLVTNNTRVIPARLYGFKPSGGKVEIMLERVVDEYRALAQIKTSKPARPGLKINLADEVTVTVLERLETFFMLEFTGLTVADALDQYGVVPLPPYIQRVPDKADLERYQTVYARHAGAVAAPTAGLHFDQAMLDAIAGKGIQRCEITLHVGAGTYQPVRVSDISQHKMHAEVFSIGQVVIDAIRQTRVTGGRVIAVGTTSVRALESAVMINGLEAPIQAETDIFIYPGFEFKIVDALLTNFHLPKSTLLMMVSAFGGFQRVLQAYRHAVESQYRFFSYGDAMFITRERALARISHQAAVHN